MEGGERPVHTVLVVDNEPFNLDLVQTVLARGGFNVITATSGAESIDVAREQRPDLVLMDLQLPEMDGLEATRRIVADPASGGVKVVAYSAMVMPADRDRALDAGCVGFIAKPVGARELIALVSGYLGG
jgi:two-component system, cell cycle response regulator DivK